MENETQNWVASGVHKFAQPLYAPGNLFRYDNWGECKPRTFVRL